MQKSFNMILVDAHDFFAYFCGTFIKFQSLWYQTQLTFWSGLPKPYRRKKAITKRRLLSVRVCVPQSITFGNRRHTAHKISCHW